MSRVENAPRRRLGFRRRRSRRPGPDAMTVMEHLVELRDRIIKSLAAFALISVVAFIVYPYLFDILLGPYCSLPEELKRGTQGCNLIITKATGGFQFRLKVTALAGFLFASPVWLYQLWAFVTPGLTLKEKRYALPFVVSSVTFFLVGSTIAYLALPGALSLLLRIGGPDLIAYLDAESYLNFVGLMLIAFGVMFELPLVLFFLGLSGVVSTEQLRRQRKVAIVSIVALSAVVTPSQDPYTMMILAVPLYVMYELTIVLLSIMMRRRAREAV